jgi:hypothetical protein
LPDGQIDAGFDVRVLADMMATLDRFTDTEIPVQPQSTPPRCCSPPATPTPGTASPSPARHVSRSSWHGHATAGTGLRRILLVP